MYPRTAIVAIGFILLQAADAYWLDAPCTSVPNFQDSISNAFDFASTAVALLEAQNHYVLDLFDDLFSPGDTATVIGHLSGLSQISGYSGVGNYRSAAVGDVFIACDYSRYTSYIQEGDVHYYYDPVGRLAETHSDTYFTCRYGPMGSYLPLLAYVDNKGATVGRADLMQICPWVFHYIAPQRWSGVNDLDPRWLVNPPQSAIDLLPGFKGTPIDLYGLLETLILHELAHTTAGGKAEDVQHPDFRDPGSCGWETTRGLKGYGSANNAESLALFGLGSKLIQLGFSNADDGSLYPIRLPAKSKKERALSEGDEKAEELAELFNMRMKKFVA